MPADSQRLEEEGVVIPPTRADEETLRELASEMRFPRQRLADLRAQAAANRIGAAASRPSWPRATASSRLRTGMEEILAYAERRTRAALAELPDGTYAAEDVLEDDGCGEPRDVDAAGRGDDRRRLAWPSTSAAPIPRSRATSTARSR